MSASPRVAIIGAGVIGLSTARALSCLGAQVYVFERAYPGAGTSGRTYAWVNSNGKNPNSYHELNCAGMREHLHLQETTTSQARWLDPCGTYEWATTSVQQARLEQRAQLLTERGYTTQRITSTTLQRLIPELCLPSSHTAIWSFPDEALACPSLLLARLWSEARLHQAQLHTGIEVLNIQESTSCVTIELSTGERWQGDYVVLATGRWTTALTQMLGTPLAMVNSDVPDKRGCGFLATSIPLPIQLRANLITPDLNIRPDGGGRVMLQAPDLDKYADPASENAPHGLIAQEILARLHRLFTLPYGASLEHVLVGQRARPADGLPAVGFLTDRQRCYVIATHSGITLGPLLGRLTAQEILGHGRDPLLNDYAPDRLLHRDPKHFSPIATLHYPAEQ